MGSDLTNPGLTPVPLKDIHHMATAFAKSGLFGIKTIEQAVSLMLISQAEGRHPALAARDYDIIQGKPSKKAEAMLRDFLTSGGKVTWHKLDDSIADATFSHPAGGEVRITWDMNRAKAAGLAGKDNWKKHPRQMLRSRTVSEGVRTVCPMATSGMHVPEEVQDYTDEKRPNEPKDVSPSEPVQTPEATGVAAAPNENSTPRTALPLGSPDYVIPIGKFRTKALKDVPDEQLARIVHYFLDQRAMGKPVDGSALDYLENAQSYLEKLGGGSIGMKVSEYDDGPRENS